MSKVKVNIIIAGRQYPMSVKSDEEEIIRKAGKQINTMIRDYESKYSVQDKQDALAMSALQFAVRFLSLDHNEQTEDKRIEDKLRDMISHIHNQT